MFEGPDLAERIRATIKDDRMTEASAPGRTHFNTGLTRREVVLCVEGSSQPLRGAHLSWTV